MTAHEMMLTARTIFSDTRSLMEMSDMSSAGSGEVLLRPQTTEEVSQILK